MLYLIGIGLHDEKDISLKAIEAIKKSDEVYAETYTSNWHGDFSRLGQMTGKEIEVLPRERVESDFLIERAKNAVVALLVPGDPLAATTHIQLLIDAKNTGIETRVIHSSSIYSAIAESGLQIYKFGRATTLVAPEKGFDPLSPYDIIVENKKMGLHSLVLLCVKSTETECDSALRSRSERQAVWSPSGSHMEIKDGLELLLKMEKRKNRNLISRETKVVACCELGGNEQEISYGTVSELIEKNPKGVPAVILIPGSLNFKEEEALEMYSC